MYVYVRAYICASVHASVKAVACLLTLPSAERKGENANSQAPECAGGSGVLGAAPCEVGGHHQRPHRRRQQEADPRSGVDPHPPLPVVKWE